MDEGFAAYKVRGKVISDEMDNLVTYFISSCNDETSVAAAERVVHIKGLKATVKFSFEVRGVNIITCT